MVCLLLSYWTYVHYSKPNAKTTILSTIRDSFQCKLLLTPNTLRAEICSSSNPQKWPSADFSGAVAVGKSAIIIGATDGAISASFKKMICEKDFEFPGVETVHS